MMYAKINSAGVIEYTVESTQEQPGLTAIDYDIGQSPGDWYAFNVNTKTWEDTRTEQQKYNDAVRPAIQKRASLLAASDWTQIPNSPLTAEKQTAWATYRQALRDIPTQTEYPFTIVWPTPPQ
jgi:hypothetical protein